MLRGSPAGCRPKSRGSRFPSIEELRGFFVLLAVSSIAQHIGLLLLLLLLSSKPVGFPKDAVPHAGRQWWNRSPKPVHDKLHCKSPFQLRPQETSLQGQALKKHRLFNFRREVSQKTQLKFYDTKYVSSRTATTPVGPLGCCSQLLKGQTGRGKCTAVGGSLTHGRLITRDAPSSS